MEVRLIGKVYAMYCTSGRCIAIVSLNFADAQFGASHGTGVRSIHVHRIISYPEV